MIINNISGVKRIVIIGIMSSLVFLGTYLTRVDISLFGGHTMIHLGNMFCLIAAMLFGRQCGALAGAIGMSLFDIVSGRFIVYFPFIFILKYTVGFTCGYIKYKYNNKLSKNKLRGLAIVSALLVNIIFSPIISLFVKVVIYNFNFYVSLINTMATVVSTVLNSVISGILAFILLKFLEPVVVKGQ